MRLRAIVCSAVALITLTTIAPPSARAAVVNVTPATFAAALAAAQDGDTLVLRSGLYRGVFVRSNISNLTITGRGNVLFETGTDDSESILEFRNVDGLTIERLSMRRAGNDAIDLYDCSNFTARKLRIEDCGDSGIEDENTQGYLVEKCRFSRCDWSLAVGYRRPSTGVVVRGNRVSESRQFGIELNADDALVERNTLAGGDGEGISFRSTHSNATITRNTLTRTGSTAILVTGSGHTVANNRIARGGSYGIELSGGGGNTCTGNRVLSCSAAGLYVTSTLNTISRNLAKGNAPFDLQSSEPAEANTYEANTFGTTQFGVGGG